MEKTRVKGGNLTSGARPGLGHVDGGGGRIAGRRGRWVGAGITGDVELFRLGVQHVDIGVIDGGSETQKDTNISPRSGTRCTCT